jgi:hypothetical protein
MVVRGMLKLFRIESCDGLLFKPCESLVLTES